MKENYNKSKTELSSEFKVDFSKGLSSEEAKKRLEKYGKNVLNIETTPLWKKLIEPFRDLFMIILLAALVLSIIQGSTSEIIIILIDIAADAGIFYFQQFSTERILRGLKNQTKKTIKVLRDGKETGIDAEDLVPGDIMFLNEGDRISADARIIEETGVLTNESMLTGESDSIEKSSNAIHGTKKIYEQKNMVFSGSFMITGTGKAVVTSTGNNTEYGHIASLASNASTISPIQEKINKLVIKIAIAVLSSAAIIFIIQLINNINFYESAQFTLAMIVSAIPEDLPIATAVILAIGASRMAKKKALVKELRAIESIGVVTTVASDKTGTLTENRLAVQKTWSLKSKNPVEKFISKTIIPTDESSDPMDICLQEYVEKSKLKTENNPDHSYTFEHGISMSGNLFEEKNKKLIYLKGEPETIIRHSDLTNDEKQEINMRLSDFAEYGYKVVAIAKTVQNHLINELGRLDKKEKFDFIGLVAMSDEIREEAKGSIEEANSIGVKVKMITGDHAGTALAIGKQLGLAKKPEDVLNCSKLDKYDEKTMSEKIKSATVFARVTPEDKFEILEKIKATEIVAMTGDGVNDVPALTNAHVGIAMGDGPSIVQDAGDIILVNNNFENIVNAIKEGRVVLSNIRRMLIYLLATNAGEVLTMIGALIFGRAQLLFPIQILWINLVTDSIMILPIGLEPAERKVLSEKPEAKNAPILSRTHIERIIISSISMAIMTLFVYFASSTFLSHDESNTLAFVSLVVMQWANAFTSRGIYESCFKRLKVKNHLFVGALFLAIALQLLATFGPLKSFVSVVEVPILPLALVSLMSFLFPIITVETHKILCRKRKG